MAQCDDIRSSTIGSIIANMCAVVAFVLLHCARHEDVDAAGVLDDEGEAGDHLPDGDPDGRDDVEGPHNKFAEEVAKLMAKCHELNGDC